MSQVLVRAILFMGLFHTLISPPPVLLTKFYQRYLLQLFLPKEVFKIFIIYKYLNNHNSIINNHNSIQTNNIIDLDYIKV
jgi:hypothetical protein